MALLEDEATEDLRILTSLRVRDRKAVLSYLSLSERTQLERRLTLLRRRQRRPKGHSTIALGQFSPLLRRTVRRAIMETGGKRAVTAATANALKDLLSGTPLKMGDPL